MNILSHPLTHIAIAGTIGFAGGTLADSYKSGTIVALMAATAVAAVHAFRTLSASSHPLAAEQL